MSEVVIKVENLGKQYRLGKIGTGTLSHDLNRWWARLTGKEDPYLKIGQENITGKNGSEYVWALKDINFELKQGEVLGIIGKNGAGKSTLLKILSRVTQPTLGEVKIKGRIASLLEVGTGFHPELTGRENIFLNGAILGMTKAEIRKKYDEIVDFSGVEKYIDTPVKRYSSGMYVRLAFAVAAHLEPEILIVDEVLAVGDAEFQKKCLGKMKDVAGQGRTVLFVSHNMPAVKSLCQKGLFLVNGSIAYRGDIDLCVSNYLRGNGSISNHKLWQIPEIRNTYFELHEIGIRTKGRKYEEVMRMNDDLELMVKIKIINAPHRIDTSFVLKDENGTRILTTGSGDLPDYDSTGTFVNSVVFPANFFNWGNFSIDLFVVEKKKEVAIIVNDIISFTILNNAVELGSWMGKTPGALFPRFAWDRKHIIN